jgi:IS5 family transposase
MSFADRLVAEAAGGNAVLEKILAFVDWKPVAELVGEVRGGVMGAPGYPALMMFKVLLLQRWYGLSDPAMEETLKDRLSFRHFAGMALTEAVPDHCSIWRFRQTLGTGLAERLFAEIGRQIETKDWGQCEDRGCASGHRTTKNLFCLADWNEWRLAGRRRPLQA